MNYETIKLKKVEKSCPACEDYAQKHSIDPPKIAVMACEGACSRGEVARIAANLIAHKLARENTVRICLGGAFTKDTGQRNLVRRANKVIAVEGCFISCSSRMMKGVLQGFTPVIVQADMLYETDSDAFGIDEFPEEEIKEHAQEVAETVVREHINNEKPEKSGSNVSGCSQSRNNNSCCSFK